MHILFAPNSTGAGHNMRALAIIKKLSKHGPSIQITVVLLSLNNIFFELYKQAGCRVIALQNGVIDHSKVSHLTKTFDWETYIDGYISNSFLNSSLIVKYTSIYLKEKPDLIVSDYNLSASAAAHIGGFNHALVTERYDFTLFQISNEELIEAGFVVNTSEINDARESLHKLFEGIISSAKIILTDKPYMPDFDKNTALEYALNKGKVKFVGPMIRDIPFKNEQDNELSIKSLGIDISDDDKVIVASVGGTTMFIENKNRLINTYFDLYESLRHKVRNLKMILICRDKVNAPDGVYVYDYIPNWLPLLNRTDVLLSAPGWITATEVALLKIPVVYILADLSEYHEVEASKRLKALGFNSYINPDIDFLSEKVIGVINENRKVDINIYNTLVSSNNGSEESAKYLIEIAKNEKSDKYHDDKEIKFTRMLLSNNGSTTVLLESLFNTKIHVEVVSQDIEIEIPDCLKVELVKYFNLNNKILFKRESQLLKENGELVCLATVYYEADDSTYIPEKDETLPLGKLLMAKHIKQYRDIISTGNTVWPESMENKICSFKEYVISLNPDQNIYVIEKFNPTLVTPLHV